VEAVMADLKTAAKEGKVCLPAVMLLQVKMDLTCGLCKLAGFETVRAIALEPTPFTVSNDMMTPSYKLRRSNVRHGCHCFVCVPDLLHGCRCEMHSVGGSTNCTATSQRFRLCAAFSGSDKKK
jgi:hypothetical protein